MSRSPAGYLEWDVDSLAKALHVDPGDVREYFTDGRRVSFILERRLAREVLQGSLAKNEGAAFDILDKDGARWEVRSITEGGVYFCPSSMVGSGRLFDEQGFLRKLDELAGYVLVDVERFPRVPYWKVSAVDVRNWYLNDDLGNTTKISRTKALDLLRT